MTQTTLTTKEQSDIQSGCLLISVFRRILNDNWLG